jgi:tetratricopeptide (TPR) repeat protein
MFDGRKHFARAMLKHGRYDAAAHALGPLLRSNPNDREALYGYAMAMQRTGRYTAAENALRQLAATAPTDAQTHYKLGLALARQQRFAEAEHSFAQARWLQEGTAPPMPISAPAPLPVRRGYRLTQLAAFVRRAIVAALLLAAGLVLQDAHQPGRTRWLAERLKWPSDKTVVERTEFFDAVALDVSIALLALATVLLLRAVVSLTLRTAQWTAHRY